MFSVLILRSGAS